VLSILELPLGKRQNMVMYDCVGFGILPENCYFVIALYRIDTEISFKYHHPASVWNRFWEFRRSVA